MDVLLGEYGVRDVVVLVEDLDDQTKKVAAGTRDMLISAVSEMTVRSKAVKLIAFGGDSKNTISYYKEAQSKNQFRLAPQYAIRGSISQFEDNVAKKTSDGGISIAGIEFGSAKSATTRILGVDLTVMQAEDLSIVPGVSSKNSVVIYQEGAGYDASASYKKFGIFYQASLSKSEGTSVALRNLVELAAIELFGKLARVPYWTCLGAGKGNEAVESEIADWYFALADDTPELVKYFQAQFAVRGYYAGPVDGAPNPEFAAALSAYSAALQLPKDAQMSEFFKAFLLADHARLKVSVPALPVTGTNQGSAPPISEQVRLTIAAQQPSHLRGQEVQLVVVPTFPTRLYCYFLDEKAQVFRIYPNRFAQDAVVSPERPLQVPGSMSFKLLAADSGKAETVTCFATATDVLQRLPAWLEAGDFAPLPGVSSIEPVRRAFEDLAGKQLGVASYVIQPR